MADKIFLDEGSETHVYVGNDLIYPLSPEKLPQAFGEDDWDIGFIFKSVRPAVVCKT